MYPIYAREPWRHYLPKMAAALIGAFGLTEPTTAQPGRNGHARPPGRTELDPERNECGSPCTIADVSGVGQDADDVIHGFWSKGPRFSAPR
jgi:hypothetical protein